MGARFVPITITVSGGQQGAAEVNRLSSAFNQLDNASSKTATGGLRNSFNATNLIRSEIQSLGSQIPIVGRFFNGLTADALRYVQAGAQVSQQMKLQKTAFDDFTKLVARTHQATGGVLPVNLFGGSFGDLHVDAATISSVENQQRAFANYLRIFQSIEDPAKQAELAIDHFGVKGAQLLPVLQSMSAAELETSTATAAVGTSFLAVAAPIAIALAAVVALAVGFGLAVKGGVELINLATTQASKLQDLSDKTNFQVETLQGLNVGAIKAGSNIEKLSAGLGIFDKNITQAYESDTKLAKQFKDFNIDVSNNEVALRQVLAALAAMPPGAKQTELAMLAFGKSGKDVVGVLKNLDGTLDEQIEKLKQMGFIMSRDDVKAAADFGDKLDLLKLKVTAVGARIGLELIPYADKLIDKFDKLANQAGPNVARWADQTIESVKNVNAALVALANLSPGKAVVGDSSSGAGIIFEILFGTTGVGQGLLILRDAYQILDKIGSKLPKVGEVGIGAALGTGSVGIEPRLLAGHPIGIAQSGLDSLFGSKREDADKILSTSKARMDEAANAAQNFGDRSNEAALKLKIQKEKILDLPPALEEYRDAIQKQISSNNAAALAEARRLDQLQATKKANDEAAKAAEKLARDQAAVLEKNRDQLAALKQQIDDYGDSTHRMAVEKQISAQKTDVLTKSQLILNDVMNKTKLVNADILDAQDTARKSAQRTIDVDAFLTQQIQLQKDAQTELTNANYDGVTASDALQKALRSKGALLAEATPGLREAAQAEAARTTALQEQARAAKRFARSPLGQAREEFSRLKTEESGLYDPILVKQRLQNDLLRDKIDLESRDLSAVVSLARSQAELADKSTYHAIQANAQVAEFMARTKSVTEIVASAKTGVIETTFDYLDRGLAKANSHLGRMGDLLTQIEGDFIKLAATKFFQWLFQTQGPGARSQESGILGNIFGGGGPGGTPTFAGGAATLGGGATGGQSLSGQFLNFIRGGGGGATNYASTAPFLGGLSALTNEGIGVPTSLSSQSGILSAIHESGHAAPAISSGVGFKATAAQFLPFITAGIGASLGSRFGIGGQIGGGLLGAGAGLVGSALLGGTQLSTIAATLGISSGLLAGATFGIGAAVLIASIIISKNAQRRKNETDRATLNGDTYSQIIQVLNDARAGKYDSAGAAIAAFDQIKSNYFQRISGYDSKTKRIATDVWNDTKNGFEVYRPLISQAAQKAIEGRELAKNMIPEFASGGMVPYRTSYFSMATGLTPIKVTPGEVMIPPGGFGMTVPGVDRGYDSVYTMARPGTRVLTKTQASGARGFATGGTLGQSGNGEPIVVNVYLDNELTVGDETASKIVQKGAKTPDGQKVIVNVIQNNQADRVRR